MKMKVKVKMSSPGGIFSDKFATASELPEPDVQVHTSAGLRIPAHSSILAMASLVLEREMDKPQNYRRSEGRVIIPILGVPCEAVTAFIRGLYTPMRCSADVLPMLEKYGIHLLALSHVYAVQQLKQRCIKSLCNRLTVENVIDVLQLARLCDAPDLRLTCLKLVSTKFKAVEKTEGWRFLHKHDPWLELDILEFIDEAESRRKRNKRQRQEQCVYLQLSEAMDCLTHICTSVGPSSFHADPASRKKSIEPCGNFSTRHGLQTLIRHFGTCDMRMRGEVSCCRCKRMIQLLRLHACLCESAAADHTKDPCTVPLCRQFKMKMQMEKKQEDAKWRLLAKKLLLARASLSLSSVAAKRKRENHDQQQHQQLSDPDHFRIHRHRLRNMRVCWTEASQMAAIVVPPV